MPELDPLLLSRIQFAFTIGFHILFPTLTIGLAFFLVTLEGLWLRTGNPVYVRLYRLWTKVFALTFGMGVVSGIVMTYQLGTNFGVFAGITGPVLGPLLSVEVLTAFFVEAGFIGIMLFGWNRVGPRLHFAATVMVLLGTLNSAFWILVANSWMHTPAGTELIDGRFVVTDWWAVIFNPSMPYRVAHMTLASFLTTALVIAGASAFYLLRGRFLPEARRAFSVATLAIAVLAPSQIVMGDLHGLNTLEHQPTKIAAMEGLWETTEGAPLVLFALPDQQAEENRFAIEIPRLASFILTHDWDGEVPGLTAVAPEDRPPVAIVFWSFRIMVGLGFAFLAIGFIGLWLRFRRRLLHASWFHKVCLAFLPAGFVATLAGWVTTEVGRQPYTVYGLLRTADSASAVAGWQVALSLLLFIAVYGVLFAVYAVFARRVILHGPNYDEPLPTRQRVLPTSPKAHPAPAE